MNVKFALTRFYGCFRMIYGNLYNDLSYFVFFIPVDTPDPFVSLFIKTSSNGMQRTRTIDNDVNPTWNETFKFYIDDRISNELGILINTV